MTKTELIESIAATTGLSKAASGEALGAVIEAVSKSLKKGNAVTITGFGTFSVAKRKARTGRNPRTGEPIKIKASKSIKFSAGKTLKDTVN